MTDPTYIDVAQFLPTDIRESIEAALPCRNGSPHSWEHGYIGFNTMDQVDPVYAAEWWTCRSCSLTHSTNPDER